MYSTNPFTEVNINLYINSHFTGYLLPSALADGFYKLLLPLALATFWLVSAKRLIQLIYKIVVEIILQITIHNLNEFIGHFRFKMDFFIFHRMHKPQF